MNFARALAALLVAILALALVAETHAQVPELKVLQVQYDNLVSERVTEACKAGLAKLDANYRANVERGLADAKAAGDLTIALSFQDEIRRITAKGTLPANDEELADPLKKLRNVYRTELAKLEEQRVSNRAALLTPYVERLKQLEMDLTKANRLDEAKAVMDYRHAFLAAGVPANGIAGNPMNAEKLAVVAVVGPKVRFADGAKAYSNRNYPVTRAPQALVGLKLLQHRGGPSISRKIEVKTKGVFYVACVVDGTATDKAKKAVATDQTALGKMGFHETEFGFTIHNLELKVYSKVVDESFTLPPSNAFCGIVVIGNLE